MYYEDISETKDGNFPVYYDYTVVTGQLGESLHWHEELEILYCASGVGMLYCDRERIELMEGDIIIINPYELHGLYSDKGYLRQILLIGRKLLKDFGCEDVYFKHCIKDDEITQAFLKINAENVINDRFTKQALMALTTQILVKLCRDWNVPCSELPLKIESKRKIIVEVMEYIDRNFTNPIGIDTICSELGYSKSYLCRAFHEISGLTIARQIAARRIYYAGTLLATKKYTVSECALMSGFSSASYFSKLYKKIFGYAPSEAVKCEIQ